MRGSLARRLCRRSRGPSSPCGGRPLKPGGASCADAGTTAERQIRIAAAQAMCDIGGVLQSGTAQRAPRYLFSALADGAVGFLWTASIIISPAVRCLTVHASRL